MVCAIDMRKDFSKIIIFTDDFKPNLGGVSEYSYQLACFLKKHHLLHGVMTTRYEFQDHPFKVYQSRVEDYKRNLGERRGDHLPFIRKINTFIYYLRVNINALLDVMSLMNNAKKALLLVTSYYNLPTQVFMKWCLRFKLNYALVLYGLDILCSSSKNKKLFNQVFKNAEVLVLISKATQKLLNGKYKDASEKQIVLYPGLNVKELSGLNLLPLEQIEARFNLKLKDKIILSCVAHLIKRKGIDIAVEAISRVISDFPNVIFLIAGDGPEKNKLETLIRSKHLNDSVFLLGTVSDIEKFSILKHSEVYVMPTRNMSNHDFEGFGISFLEASYFENIVIGGADGGVKEAIRDKVTGFTIDFENKDSVMDLANLLKSLLKNKDKMREFQTNGKSFVISHFDWENLISGFLADLRTLSIFG